MSGKRAASALMQFDCDLANEIAVMNGRFGPIPSEEAEEFAQRALGLWTVSLAAAAAGVSEEVTVAALLLNHMRVGTACVCQGIAKGAAQATAPQSSTDQQG